EIEAEFRMSERDMIVAAMKRCIREIEEFEVELHMLERRQGLPSFYRSYSITERMRVLAFHADAISHVAQLLDVVNRLRRGDEIPTALRENFSKQAEAERSAMEQLSRIVNAKKK